MSDEFSLPDDRINCRDCRNLDHGRCLQAQSLGASPGYRPVIQPRRCAFFRPVPGLRDQRTGRERWPLLTQFTSNRRDYGGDLDCNGVSLRPGT